MISKLNIMRQSAWKAMKLWPTPLFALAIMTIWFIGVAIFVLLVFSVVIFAELCTGIFGRATIGIFLVLIVFYGLCYGYARDTKRLTK
jgi:hypothetical protein